MVTKDELTMIAWNIIRNLIMRDPDRFVYEILEILMIGNNSIHALQRLSQGASSGIADSFVAQSPPNTEPSPGMYQKGQTLLLQHRNISNNNL